VYRIADRFEAKFHKREGKPMNLSDHLTEYLRDDERAKSDARAFALNCANRERRKYKRPIRAHDLLAELQRTLDV